MSTRLHTVLLSGAFVLGSVLGLGLVVFVYLLDLQRFANPIVLFALAVGGGSLLLTWPILRYLPARCDDCGQKQAYCVGLTPVQYECRSCGAKTDFNVKLGSR